MIGASLSKIQDLIISEDKPKKLLYSSPKVVAALDKSLTKCMALFSCLDDELRKVSRHARSPDDLSALGKVQTLGKQETFIDLLNGTRGQHQAITTLIQLNCSKCVSQASIVSTQTDDIRESLAEITQLLRRSAPQFKEVVERTDFLTTLASFG